MIRKERKTKYKYYKKIFKARDMASKYLKEPVTVKQVEKFFGASEINVLFTATLAMSIVNTGCKRPERPAPPPAQYGRESFIKPSMTIVPPLPPVTKKEPSPPPAGPEPREI
jgi:hypothetical protein